MYLNFGGDGFNTSTNSLTGLGVRGIVFESGSAARTLDNNLLSIGFGGTGKIENNSANTQTINLTLSNAFGNNLELNAVAGALVINNIFLGSSATVDLYGSNNNTLNFKGLVSGSATMNWINSRSNRVVFSASNSMSGTLNVYRGLLIASNASATFGSSTINIGEAGQGQLAEVWFGTGGTAQTNALSNNIVINSENANNGANRAIVNLNTSGTNTITGTVANNNSGLTAKLFLTSGGTLRFSNVVSGLGGFYMDGGGGGTLELSAANTFSGGLFIDNGVVKLSGASATAGSGTLALGAVSGSSGATVLYSGTGGGITLTNSTLEVRTGTGARRIVSENTSNTNTFTGTINLSKSLTISNASGGQFNVTGAVTNTGGLTKEGAGTLFLAANNSFSGGIIISEGTLSITNANSLGTGQFNMGNGSTNTTLSVSSNATITNVFQVYNAAANAVIDVASATTTTISGKLTQDGAKDNTTKFGKAGAGTLVLSSLSSDFNGQIQIGNGTLVIGVTGALGTNTSTGQRGIDLGFNVGDVNQANNVAVLASNGVTVGQSFYVALNTNNATRTIGIAGAGTNTFSNQFYLDGNLTVDAGANATDLVTISGNLTNTGGIIKTNAGILVLSASNNHSGGTTLGSGTLRVGNNNALGAGSLTINGGTLASSSGTAYTLTNNITMGGNVTIGEASTGTGALTLSGTLALGATRTFTVNNAANNIFSGVISGTGFGVTKQGAGTLTLSGANSYTGATTVTAGTLAIGADNRLDNSSAVTVDGGTLSFGGFSDTVSSFTISIGTFTNGTLTATTYALQGGTVAGNLGTGTINATGNTALNGTAAATTVNVSGSTLTLGSAGRLAAGATVNVTNSGIMAIAGAESVTSLVLSNGTLNGTGQTLTASGGYSLNGGTVNANLGTGTATASAGTTTFNGTNAGALTLSGGSVTTGGANKLSDTGAVTVNTGTLTIGGSDTVGALSGSGGTVSVGSGATFTTSFDAASNNYAGTISGAGIFAKAGSGTLSLSGDASGAASLSVTAGRLQIGTGSTTGSIGNDSVALSSGANLAFNRSDNITYNGVISGSGGTVTKLGGGTLTISNTQTYTGATTVSAGTLSYVGTNTSTATTVGSGGTLIGSGSLGNVTVQSGGTINPGLSPGTLSVSNLVWEAGGNYNWQVYNAAGTAGATNGYDTILGNSLNITATEGNKFNINLWSLSGIGPDTNGNAINFTNTSGYTWTLGSFTNGITNFAANLFSINTAATNGTAGFANTLSGAFSIYTTNSTNLILAYTAADTTYNVTVASGSTNQGAASGGTNQFVGLSALNKLGAGTLVMTNTNTYSGVTTIVEGTISIVTNAPSGANGALGAAITDVLVGTSTNAVAAGFDIGAANVTNSRNLNIVAGSGAAARTVGTTNTTGTAEQAGGVAFNTNATLYAASGGTMLYSGLLSGGGNLTISNSGTSIFSASNSYTGTTTILTNATLVIANGNALGATGSGTTVNAGGTLAISNGITSAEGLTISGDGVSTGGAIRSISGNNTLSGGITLAAASRINSDTGLLTLSGGINGANFGLTVGGAGNTTISGAITNSSGSLTKTNAGTLTLSGANTYSGGTLVGQGTVVGNTTSLQGTITNNGAVVFDQSTAGSYTGVMSGGGSLTKTNAGTLTLSGANSYSGGSTIGQGGVVVGNNSALGSGTVNLLDGTSLSSDGSPRTLTNSMNIQGILFGGTGALTLNGNLTNNRGAAIAITNSVAGGLTLSNLALSHTATGRTVTLAGTGNTTINGVISDGLAGATSSFTINNSGTTTLNGANTLSGTLTLSAGAGTLVIGNNSALGAGSAVFGDGVTVNSDSSARSVTNNIQFQNLQIGGSGALTFSGTLTHTRGGGSTLTNNNSAGLTLGNINLANSTVNREVTFAGTGNTTVTGVIANGGTASASSIVLNATGTTLTLSGANTYGGATTITAGTLLAVNNTALGTNTTGTTVADGATLAFSNNINSAEAITISGNGVGSNGALRNISGNNTNTGTVTLGATNNRIQVDTGTSLTLGAIANGVSTNNLTLSANGTLRVTGAFTGAGTSAVLQKDGAGTLVISNSGTTGQAQLQLGNGTVTVEQGSFSTSTSTGTRALDVGISGTNDSTNNVAFYANSGVTISNSIYIAPNTTNSALRILGTESTNGTATFDREIYLGGSLTVSAANGGTALFSGNIVSSGNLTKTNAGTVILAGVNTFGGAVAINGGTLVVSNSAAINDTNAVTIASGATLSLGSSETVGSIAGGGNITLLGNQLIAGGNGSSTEFSGIMSSTSSAAEFVKFGAGTLTLSGSNTMNGQLYLVNGTTLFTVNQGSGFTNTINLGETNGSSASATVAFGGSGLSVTNPINVRSGNNGTMTIEAQNASGTLTLGGALTLSKNATLKATNGGDVILSGAVDIGTSQLFTDNTTGSDITISGNISANAARSGELLVNNTGTVYLTGNNSANMKVTLSQGTLVVGNITNLGDPTGTFFGSKLNLNGGTLSATNDVTAGANFGVTVSANGGNLLASSGKTLKFVDFINDTGAGTAAYTLGIGGGGTVIFEKPTGNNQFNGNMTFSVTNGSTLSTPNLLALGNSSTNIISLNNGTFAYTGNTGTSSQRFTIGASGGTINVSSNGQTLTLTNAATLTGALTKSGNGILDINRANTGTGGANVTGGILRIGNASALGTGGTVAVTNGATLQLSNGINFARTLNLSGNGTVSGALLSVNGANTNSGGITLGSDAIIGVSAGSLLVSGNITNAGNRLTLDTYGIGGSPLTVSGVVTGAGGLSKIGGDTAILTGANDYQGGTVITAGTLQVGSGGGTGQLGTGNITNNATLAINRTGLLSIADAISGTGVLTKSGAGTLTLTGANSYNGGTLISAGAISGTTAGIQGNITNNSALIFDQSTTGTYAGIISGTGTLAMTNSGTVSLTGANTFSGGVTVNAGTLALNRSGGPALGGTNAIIINTNGTLRTDAAGQIVGAPLVTVNAGGTYNLNGFNQTNALTGGGSVTLGAGTLSISNTVSDTFSGVIAGTTGGVTKIGSGVQIFSGNNTYTNTTTLTEGTMRMAAASGNVFAGNILINGGTLNYSNSVDNQIADTASVTMSSGSFDMGARNETITSLIMSGGTLARGGGVLTLSGASTLTAGAVNYSAASGGLTFGSSLQLGGVTFSYGSASTPGGTEDTIRLGGDVGYASSATGQALFTNTAAGVGAFDLGGAQRTFNLTNSGTLGASTPEMAVYWAVRDGGITKDGTGALLLGRANTHTNTTLTAGDLLVGDNAAVGAGTVNLNGGTFASADATARTITNALSIGGDITLGQASGGTGVLTFSNADLGNGTRSITAVTNVNFVGAVTNGSITKAGGATLALSNTGTSLNNLNITAGAVAVQTNATVGGLAGSGSGALSLAGGTLTVNASTNSSFGQAITGVGALTKSGTGTVTLTASNNFSGATTINAGTLAINGTNSDSAVTINSTGTLAGTGLVGATTVKSGGLISPGNSIGTLAVDTLTLEGGGGYVWEVANVTGSAGTDYDLISVGGGTGSATVSATSGNPFTIYLTSYTGFTNWNAGGTFSWNIIDWGTVTGFDASAFTVNTNNFTGSISGTFTFANTNGYLVMSYAAGTPTYDTNSGTWSAGFVPSLANGNNAIFDGPGGNATNNISTNTLTSIGNLTFSNTAGSYTLTADSGSAGFDTASRLLVGGSIVNNSSNAQTINLAIGFDAARTIDAAAGNMTFGGTISNGVGLIFTGASNNTVSGVVSGAGTVAKTGTGTLVLSGANDYTGATTISNGVLQLGNATALGTTAAGTTVISGATLDLNGQTVGAEALSLAGTGVGGNGALINSSASASSLSGAVTLTGNTTVGTTGNMTLSGAVGGAFSLTKIGAATLTLSASNAYSGGTVVNGGTIAIGNNNALGTGTVTLGSGTTIGATGSTRTNANNLVANGDFTFGFTGGAQSVFSGNLDLGGATRAITLGFNSTNAATIGGVVSNGGINLLSTLANATLNLTGASTFSGPLNINGGTLAMVGGGTLNTAVAVDISRTNGNSRFDISGITADTLTIGSLAAADSATATVNLGGKTLIAGGNNNSTTFGGVISNTGSFVKTGTGTMTLTRASTYTGATTISNGELALTVAGDLASASALNLAGATARFDISGKTSGETNGSLAGVAGSVVNLGSNNLTVGGDNSSTTFAGILTNTGSLTKTGTGTMTLSGANTFSGGSTLSAGVLRAANSNALGTGSLSASAGTVFEVTNSINVTNNLSLYTVRFLNGGNTLSGTITNNNTVYDVASGTTNTVSGFITGSGGVELIGGGVLAITGTTNNYTGNTTITNGTLRISTLGNSNTVGPIGVSNNVTLAGANATNAVLDYTGGNVTTDRTFVMNDGGGTINMASSSTEMTLTGSASGSGKLIVGEGTLILNGATNAFAPGSIQVDSGATLQLAANNQIGDTTGLILNGGTFRVGTASTGFSDTLGTLTLSASSTIDLGAWTTGVRQLTFANSSAITWTGTLTITNWQGVALQSSSVAEILFGTGGLTSTQLGQVYWANQDITGGTLIGGNGELVPVPEPRVYAAAVALLAVVGWRERKRLLALIHRKTRQA